MEICYETFSTARSTYGPDARIYPPSRIIPEIFSYLGEVWLSLFSTTIALDNTLFIFINREMQTLLLNYLMVFFTLLGYGYVLALVVGIFLYLYDRQRFWQNFIFFVIVALAGGTITQVLKFIIGRPRPVVVLSDVHVLVAPLTMNSFPSGHTQAIFTAAIFFIKETKKYMAVFLGIAVLVGLSRIYVGVHYPSDVLAGAIIGILVTELFYWLRAKNCLTFCKIYDRNIKKE